MIGRNSDEKCNLRCAKQVAAGMNSPRNLSILRQRREGVELEQIALNHGISRARVNQILQRFRRRGVNTKTSAGGE